MARIRAIDWAQVGKQQEIHVTTVERNEAAIPRCADLFNQRTSEWVEKCYAENAEWVELPMPGTPQGRRGTHATLRESAEQLLRLFPDRQMTIRNLVAQADQVVLEVDWKGTAAAAVGSCERWPGDSMCRRRYSYSMHREKTRQT
jgi:ketosteroid isomerase-like protein